MSDPDDGDSVGEEPTPLERVLELLVFAPVGVAVTLAEDLPGLIGKGRERFESDISNARVVGQFVVRHGQRQLVARAGKLLHRERSADVPDPSHTPPSTDGAPTNPMAATTASASPKPDADPADEAIVEGALAGYDTLSASQVVRRLESLEPDELRALHRHEASHRNRRTILNRAHQILEAGEAGEAGGPISSPPETEAAPEPDRSGE